MAIKFYRIKEQYGFLSNFYKARIFIYGRWWNYVEAPYQSAKTPILTEKDAIWQAKTAKETRDLGQKCFIVPGWDDGIKREVMKECCLAKFLQHPDLRKKLMDTGTEELIEDSPIDFWWGCGADGTGKNVLGQILMEIRQELQGE